MGWGEVEFFLSPDEVTTFLETAGAEPHSTAFRQTRPLKVRLFPYLAGRIELSRANAIRVTAADQTPFVANGASLHFIYGELVELCYHRFSVMAIETIFSILILLLSVVLHEVSHGYAAYYLGDPTAKLAGRLTLNPIKHIDPFGSILIPFLTYMSGGFIFGWAKPVPYNPYNLQAGKWGPAYVAVAGPASNLMIAAFFAGLIRLGAFGLVLPPAFVNLSALVIFVNLILAIFNLAPIPPLDGSKILFALLPYRYRGLEEWLNRYQFILVVIFLLFLWQLVFPLVSFLFRLATGLAV